MTWNDLVRKYIPNATDEEYVLWNKPPFPITLNAKIIQDYIKE
ncbi:MAG: hypothetical protein NSGCLCUN01_03900 [uncultured Clostridium sp.]